MKPKLMTVSDKETMSKTERKKYDWEAIEREYRAGQLSIREISRHFAIPYSTLNSRAKKHDWTRDLTDLVKTAVYDKLIRPESTKEKVSDRQVIEEAAERGVGIIRNHRKTIREARGSVELLLDQLTASAISREELEEFVLEETKDDKSPKRRSFMLKAISLGRHATVANNLSNALRTLVALERQAFNLGDKDGDGEEVTGINISFKGGLHVDGNLL